eukprot:2151382-Prymnesium_polylepis.1
MTCRRASGRGRPLRSSAHPGATTSDVNRSRGCSGSRPGTALISPHGFTLRPQQYPLNLLEI